LLPCLNLSWPPAAGLAGVRAAGMMS